ncbi:tripartite tricarboxylate transporter TctB family protein [Rhodobacterales bacterium HKCCE2091]|nr:tripartite tricarboxylate transporter TctB family protein [Rhodobacterales bacterium HKCCE2091]
MLSPPRSERLIGGVIAIIGALYVLQTLLSYDLGTLRRMGPGMFPLFLGIALTAIGAAIAILAPDRERELPDFAPRTAGFVLGGVVAFAVLVGWFGLAPAVVGCVLVASLAERPPRFLGALAVAGVLCVAAWAIFKVGLGLAIPMLRWPF